MYIHSALPQSSALQPTKLKPDSAPAAGFSSLLTNAIDTVNPLQHIPVISDIYQSVTGDTQSSIASIAGGGLYGGIVGAVASAGSALIENLTGNTLIGHTESALRSSSNEGSITLISNVANATPTDNASSTITSEKEITKQFFTLSSKKHEETIASLGFENENIRQQYIGKLAEKAKDLL